VVDGYDPLLAEWLFIESRHEVTTQQAYWRERMTALTQQYLIGDFYLCASERQRDWWLGLLEAHGRINAHTFRQDNTLRKLIDVVPFGLPAAPPIKTQPAIKGVWDGVAVEDKLLLWGGGLWPWLDPLTAIEAMRLVAQQRDDVRLVFPGTKHPNPLLSGMKTKTEDAKDLAARLGLINRHVFFGDWVPYERWGDVLLESDVALSLHQDTLEARLAFRSRMLEYIWAGLPTIATTGDATSDLIAQHNLGVVVNYGDVAAVADAILRLLDEPRQ
jgi:glycosyltransferase involved in cell wall biosynthesis